MIDRIYEEEDCWCSPTPKWCDCGALALNEDHHNNNSQEETND